MTTVTQPPKAIERNELQSFLNAKIQNIHGDGIGLAPQKGVLSGAFYNLCDVHGSDRTFKLEVLKRFFTDGPEPHEGFWGDYFGFLIEYCEIANPGHPQYMQPRPADVCCSEWVIRERWVKRTPHYVASLHGTLDKVSGAEWDLECNAASFVFEKTLVRWLHEFANRTTTCE